MSPCVLGDPVEPSIVPKADKTGGRSKAEGGFLRGDLKAVGKKALPARSNEGAGVSFPEQPWFSGLFRVIPGSFAHCFGVHDTSPIDPSSGGSREVGTDRGFGVGFRCLAWLLVGLPILGVLLSTDDWLRAQRSVLAGKNWSGLALFISGSANGFFLIPSILGLAFWFRRKGRPMISRALSAMLLAGIVSGLAGTALRSMIGRTRPEASVEQGWFGPRKDGQWLIGRHAYGSFPSGHASIAAGVGFMAFLLGARVGALGLAFALAVAWARFHLGAHRASDVWAGLMVGALTVSCLWSTCRDRVHREETACASSPGADGGGSTTG